MQRAEVTMADLALWRPKKILCLFNYRYFARFSLSLVNRFCRWYAFVCTNAIK